ncbi:TPA: YolD-like family protein [Bacillus mycoides]|nr:YolD-like family protein [Bacillus mycoides]
MIGRGMMRWMPFSAIKEQFEGLNELYEKQNQVQMPILDEQQLDAINEAVCEAMAENQRVSILYHNHEKPHNVSGYIHYVDTLRTELRVIDQYEKVIYIKSTCIVDIKMF